MEEEKRKRKRKKYAKCKSKSLCIETQGYKSKNIKIPNGKANASTLGRCEKGKVLDIRSDQKGSAYQSIQHLKHKYNRSKKRKKRMRREKSDSLAVKTSDFKDNFAPFVGGYSTGINSSNMVSKLNTTANNVNLKAGSSSSKKRGLKEKLKNKLESGRFRWINEKLYTTNSLSALKMFEVEPELFKIYHQGFSSQVQKWPVNPVDTMIDWIMKR